MYLVVTNNKELKADEMFEFEYIDGTALDVLIAVRTYIHDGAVLVSSPLYASSAMHRSPYKSILLSLDKEAETRTEVDLPSLIAIEASIENYHKYMCLREVDDKNAKHYAFMDKELFESALADLKKWLHSKVTDEYISTERATLNGIIQNRL